MALAYASEDYVIARGHSLSVRPLEQSDETFCSTLVAGQGINPVG